MRDKIFTLCLFAMKHCKLFMFFVLALMLAGCHDKAQLNPSHKAAICEALIGPLKYNSQNKESRRHAGDLLALDLKQRNQIGEQLKCPKYR